MENIVWEMTPWVDDFGMTYEGWSQSEEKGMTNDTLSWRFQNGMTFDASPFLQRICAKLQWWCLGWHEFLTPFVIMQNEERGPWP